MSGSNPRIPPLPGVPAANAAGSSPDLPHTRTPNWRDVPRGLTGMNPGMNTKWDTYAALGLPHYVTSSMSRFLYLRNGSTANAAVSHIYKTCWQTDPVFRRTPDGEEMDPQEKLLNDVMGRLWMKMHDGDRRSLIGCYSAVILSVADGARTLAEPVNPSRIRNGAEALLDIVPVSDVDLKAPETVQDRNSARYGEAAYYDYTPQDANGRPMTTERVHPDRVVILSPDGTMRNRPFLEPCLNAILNLDKLEGAISESAFKAARNLLYFNIDTMAKLAGTGFGGVAPQTPIAGDAGAPSVREAAHNVLEQVEHMNARFENAVVSKGMSVTKLDPQSRDLGNNVWALRASVAGAVGIPMRILFGSQSGERAATEDRKEFHQSMDARRNDQLVPRLRDMLGRFQRWGMLDGTGDPWRVVWEPLTQNSVQEKQELARVMVAANAEAWSRGEIVATAAEIREVLGLEPLTREQLEQQDEMFRDVFDAGASEPVQEPAAPAPEVDDPQDEE